MDIGVGPTLWPAPFFDSAPNADSSMASWAVELSHAVGRVPTAPPLASGLWFCQVRLFAHCACAGRPDKELPITPVE